ncbi:MAG: hydrogenase nickel incorporation protein HypB [Abditibacteriota bacterium]|nr:hydrogenase nickel incorporation protein HypB [Abditibacteriota bacterium]
MKIMMMKNISANNDIYAYNNRDYCRKKSIKLINVMASPGAGKTSVITGLLSLFPNKDALGVIEGDIASDIDAEKLNNLGYKTVQINTGGGCHLNAVSIGDALKELDIEKGCVFIENVGNLICPSAFDLGESLKLLIASVPEGSDKPFKYISMFECVDLIVLNKWDLAPYMRFDYEEFERGVRAVNEKAPIIKVSCFEGLGLDELYRLIEV